MVRRRRRQPFSSVFINSIRCLLLQTVWSLAAIVTEKSTVFTFTYRKAQVTKFDLAVKKVKDNLGSSFEQTIMGWSPRCYIPCCLEIGPPVPGKNFLKGFCCIWAWWPSWSCDRMPGTTFVPPTQGGST